MQDRYVGDIGDFVKYGLLRALGAGRHLGVAWYLRTGPDSTNAQDGRYTTYLSQPQRWRALDPALFDTLGTLVSKGERTVAAIERSGLLGDATYASEPLDIGPVPPRKREQWRSEWFERVRAKLSHCDIVFADPDNGLYPGTHFGFERKESAKRIAPSEAEHLAERRPAVVYHHNTRRRGGHEREIQHWMNEVRGCTCAYYWRPFSQRSFFVVNADAATECRLEEFEQIWKNHGTVIRKA